MKNFIYALPLTCLIFSSIAISATDGINGSTSTGTAEIQVTKGDGVRVSDLQDFILDLVTRLPVHSLMIFVFIPLLAHTL